MTAQTRVLVTTVGPYARYGMPVVEACARAGTHYADLTGEVLFVREAIDRFDPVAREAGARIVHACGYDSVPSDLTTLLLAERAAADGAGGLRDVRLVGWASFGETTAEVVETTRTLGGTVTVTGRPARCDGVGAADLSGTSGTSGS